MLVLVAAVCLAVGLVVGTQFGAKSVSALETELAAIEKEASGLGTDVKNEVLSVVNRLKSKLK